MEKLVKVISFMYSHDALLAKTFLEASGITVVMKDELTVQVHPFLSNAIGGVKLFVEKGKEEEALLLLKSGGYIDEQQPEKKEEIEIFPAENEKICPFCKSINIVKKSTPGYTFVISMLTLGFPLPFLRKVYYCYDCMKEWKVKNEK